MSTPLSQKLPWELANQIWASQLNPIISSPLSSVMFISEITLQSGDNVINHKLNRLMQGWFVVDINGAGTIYRSAPFNDKTLTLNASQTITRFSIGVF